MTRVLAEEQVAGRCRVGGVVLSDQEPALELGVQFRLARGSRAKFVTAVNAAHLTYTHFIYDCAGMARAHQWIPLPRRPFLTFLHGIEVWQGTAHPAQVLAADRANAILSNTSFTRTKAADLTPGLARASVCWLATEDDCPPAYTQSASGPPRVLILARLDEAAYKGHTELIRCWPTVRASVPNAVLTIAGTGPAASRYQQLAHELGLSSESVEFRGFVPEADMPRLWAETTVFAMPSRGEGFGLVYIEAMRHGIPVIASIHDAGPEVNIEGVTGYNVNLDRPDELPDRLIRLLRDRELATNLGANGVARWAEHFRYSAFRNRFTRFLREWIGG
ncbi:MAG: glycosyl transferase family 1 [Planctomycetaceae bacterium]|nr:glycosyl transferase family 1 [Planctomycetaceae bacterium]